jgi:hypothetical protein
VPGILHSRQGYALGTIPDGEAVHRESTVWQRCRGKVMVYSRQGYGLSHSSPPRRIMIVRFRSADRGSRLTSRNAFPLPPVEISPCHNDARRVRVRFAAPENGAPMRLRAVVAGHLCGARLLAGTLRGSLDRSPSRFGRGTPPAGRERSALSLRPHPADFRTRQTDTLHAPRDQYKLLPVP